METLNHCKPEFLDTLSRKREEIPLDNKIIMPGDIPHDQAAEAITQILSAVYGRHNLLPSIEETEDSIRSQKVIPWFLQNNLGEFTACTALVQHKDNVEIGRAANHPENGKKASILMMEAAKSHMGRTKPLTAEIRLSADFEDIEGGQGSQATAIKNIGMTPHAILPAFHHPGPKGPDRHEFFCFSILKKFACPQKITLPVQLNDYEALIKITQSLFPFTEISFEEPNEKAGQTTFSVSNQGPFSVLLPDKKGKRLSQALSEAKHKFLLAPLQLTKSNFSSIQRLMESGFIACGFDWRKPLTLLMGKLKKDTLLAPVELATDCFSPQMEQAIMKIENLFRKEI